MKRSFDENTTKEKCAMMLLSCLDWGCNTKNYEEIEESIRKRLKFQYTFDTIRFRSCIDLIGDTEGAICHFSKFGLQKFNMELGKDIGEIYLKLYGILNAIYQQIYCIVEIFEVCRIPNKLAILNKFKALKIFELRNIGGAHTINYDDKSEYIPENFKKNFFRITQCQLNSKCDNLHAVDGFGNVKEYNLYELIMEYNKLSEGILYEACLTYMDSIFSSEIKKNKLLTHYELVPFKNYDYRSLYVNDKLKEKYIKRIKKMISREFRDELDSLSDVLEHKQIECYK